ncbi:MAG: hypothetical protein AB7S46_01135, partial [Flavobacteriaceae bacterium]
GISWVSLLSLLLLVDLAFVLAHILLAALDLHRPLHHWLNIERDRSIPEFFMYGKWTASLLACAYSSVRDRSSLYMVWSLLFAYFLLDDSFQIHERLGAALVTALKLAPAFWLRARDFGELAASAGAGVVVFGAMAITYLAAGSDREESKAFSRLQLKWVAVLVFFGVFVDMLHIQIRSLGIGSVTAAAGVVEDAGEMAAASVLAALCIRQAARVTLRMPQ